MASPTHLHPDPDTIRTCRDALSSSVAMSRPCVAECGRSAVLIFTHVVVVTARSPMLANVHQPGTWGFVRRPKSMASRSWSIACGANLEIVMAHDNLFDSVESRKCCAEP